MATVAGHYTHPSLLIQLGGPRLSLRNSKERIAFLRVPGTRRNANTELILAGSVASSYIATSRLKKSYSSVTWMVGLGGSFGVQFAVLVRK